MTQQRNVRGLRRDPGGRLATIGDLLGAAFAGLAAGLAVLLVFEAIVSLAGISTFGDTNGWLAVILPVWLFTEEYRAEGFGAHRAIVTVLGAGFGVAAGMTAAGLIAGFVPSLVSGAAGAATGTVVYCLVWFYGLRWLRHRSG
ncbi:hypothetical protein AB0M02_37045 [Actinoplanes sp. NPDC051861]|uniref:hypothetical protein n=1 Tax=Actinoplanes sp. NPDC051861 TaxID=3155170 RepID=UPI0034167336